MAGLSKRPTEAPTTSDALPFVNERSTIALQVTLKMIQNYDLSSGAHQIGNGLDYVDYSHETNAGLGPCRVHRVYPVVSLHAGI